MTTQNKVAVIVGTYNGADWIEAQIASINAQIGCEIHIYIRDDGSSDKTIEVIGKTALRFPLSVIDAEGILTGSAATNFFKIIGKLDFKGYDYVAISDQDDVWFPEKIIEGIKLMLTTKSDAYSSNLIAFDNRSSKSFMVNKNSKQKRYDYLFQGASAGCTYILTNKAMILVSKIINNNFEKLNKESSHDWIIYAICRSNGLRWVHDDRSFIAYRQHSNNVFGAKPGLSGLVAKHKMIKSGWYRSNVALLSNFIALDEFELKVMRSINNDNLINKFFLIKYIFSFRRDFTACIYLVFLLIFGIF